MCCGPGMATAVQDAQLPRDGFLARKKHAPHLLRRGHRGDLVVTGDHDDLRSTRKGLRASPNGADPRQPAFPDGLGALGTRGVDDAHQPNEGEIRLDLTAQSPPKIKTFFGDSDSVRLKAWH